MSVGILGWVRVVQRRAIAIAMYLTEQIITTQGEAIAVPISHISLHIAI